jgi:hypothetical protein
MLMGLKIHCMNWPINARVKLLLKYEVECGYAAVCDEMLKYNFPNESVCKISYVLSLWSILFMEVWKFMNDYF